MEIRAREETKMPRSIGTMLGEKMGDRKKKHSASSKAHKEAVKARQEQEKLKQQQSEKKAKTKEKSK
jgi:hypothetical protein